MQTFLRKSSIIYYRGKIWILSILFLLYNATDFVGSVRNEYVSIYFIYISRLGSLVSLYQGKHENYSDEMFNLHWDQKWSILKTEVFVLVEHSFVHIWVCGSVTKVNGFSDRGERISVLAAFMVWDNDFKQGTCLGKVTQSDFIFLMNTGFCHQYTYYIKCHECLLFLFIFISSCPTVFICPSPKCGEKWSRFIYFQVR